MRLLSFNIENEAINILENINLFLCDRAEDLNDALYHSEVRFYNLIIICEEVNNIQKLLKNIDPKDCAVIAVLEEYKKEHEIQLLKSGAMSVLTDPISSHYLHAKVQSIFRESFLSDICFKDDFILNFEEQSICDTQNNKLVIKGEKTFNILTYLVRNRDKPPISKEELLNVVWDEPEMVNQNVIEVNINTIRNSLKKTFNQDFIETVRHRGYRVKI